MHQFKDSSGRVFNVVINLGTVARLRSVLAIDLLEVDSKVTTFGGHELPLAIVLQGADVVVLADVIHAVCQPHLDTLGITRDAFLALLSGDVLQDAQRALLEEWQDFFRGLNRQQSIQMIQAAKTLVTAAVQKAEVVAEAAHIRALEYLETYSTNATGSPEASAAETPAA